MKSSAMLFCGVILVLLIWRFNTGRIKYDQVNTRRDEILYRLAILVSNTMGTAIGDMTANTLGLGFERGALLFSGFIALVAAAYHFTSIPDSVMFWAAYILTRPLGATLGDTLTKPQPEGGLALSRVASSLSMIAAMVVLTLLTNQRNSSPAAAEP